jgi:hypothetical protein
MLWITLAVLMVAIIGFLANTYSPYGDLFAGIMCFLAVWAMYGIVVLFYAGYCVIGDQPFIWKWV